MSRPYCAGCGKIIEEDVGLQYQDQTIFFHMRSASIAEYYKKKFVDESWRQRPKTPPPQKDMFAARKIGSLTTKELGSATEEIVPWGIDCIGKYMISSENQPVTIDLRPESFSVVQFFDASDYEGLEQTVESNSKE